MAEAFLDSNIILRHLLGDVPEQAERASQYLTRIENGEVRVWITDSVIMEVVFTLERSYKAAKDEIRAAMLPLLELPGIQLPGKRRFREVFDLYVDLRISFGDAYHVVTMRHMGVSEILSFDRELDRVPGVRRTEP